MNKLFYEDGYCPTGHVESVRTDVNLDNPAEIEKYLRSRVFGQEEMCRQVAMLLWHHVHGRRQTAFIVGPSGSGKSEIIKAMRELYEDIYVQDGSAVQAKGWRGGVSTTDIIEQVPPGKPAIIVIDEADKAFSGVITGNDTNISQLIQQEYLIQLTGGFVTADKKNPNNTDAGVKIDTSNLSYVFVGSYQTAFQARAESESTSGFGFASEPVVHKAYENRVTREDLLSFGIIPELCGRIEKIITCRPLSEEDFCHILTGFKGNPIKQMERKYNVKLKISKKRVMQLAKEAAGSGMGTRVILNSLVNVIDDKFFESYSRQGTAPSEITI